MGTKLVQKIPWVFDRIVEIFAFLSGLLTVLVMLGICIDVIMRYFFNAPIEGMIAFAEFSLLYITFLAAPWLLRIEGHVKMDFLITHLSLKKKALFGIISSIIGVIICVVFVWYGAQVTTELWLKGVYDLFKIQGFPKAIPTAIIPVCGLALLIQFLRRAYQDLGYLVKKTEDA